MERNPRLKVTRTSASSTKRISREKKISTIASATKRNSKQQDNAEPTRSHVSVLFAMISNQITSEEYKKALKQTQSNLIQQWQEKNTPPRNALADVFDITSLNAWILYGQVRSNRRIPYKMTDLISDIRSLPENHFLRQKIPSEELKQEEKEIQQETLTNLLQKIDAYLMDI
ncbi:hypothetical protein CCR75_002440 [Bremia lactucae]|uniref:Uncharacterized protein n=1 Tax=Bremia lactucae TaxID=4779 RepID=A0A976IIF9_BRELC|nr:hypothetical protein CCR75_002440 [Bremia lactucae]